MKTTERKANRVHRTYAHPLTRETTRLRFLPGPDGTGTVSRPERAGEDVGPHVFIRGATIERCREVWHAAAWALHREGFEVTGTEFPK